MGAHRHGLALALAAVVLAVWAALMALAVSAAPASDGGRVVALFAPGRADAAFAAIIRAGGRPIGWSWAGLVWAVDTDAGGARRLEAEGAIAVLIDLPFAAGLGCGVSAPAAERSRPF